MMTSLGATRFVRIPRALDKRINSGAFYRGFVLSKKKEKKLKKKLKYSVLIQVLQLINESY